MGAAIETERNEKAEAIMVASLRLFAEQGFYGTTVPEIAAAAKVGAGTVYRYFPSKEALVNAVYQHWKHQLVTALMGQFPFEAPAREQFTHFVSKAIEFARKFALEFRFLEMHHHMPYLDHASKALESLVVGPAQAFFDRHREMNVTRDAPSGVLGGIVWGAIVGVIRAEQDGYATITSTSVDQLVDVLWTGLTKQ